MRPGRREESCRETDFSVYGMEDANVNLPTSAIFENHNAEPLLDSTIRSINEMETSAVFMIGHQQKSSSACKYILHLESHQSLMGPF
jgi:hypothetical protein